jgi:hypothetical protein
MPDANGLANEASVRESIAWPRRATVNLRRVHATRLDLGHYVP